MKVTCVACDKIIDVEDFTEETFQGRYYCSEVCENKKLKPHNKQSQIISKCLYCNEKLILTRHQYFKQNQKFCNHDCYWKDKKEMAPRRCDWCNKEYTPPGRKDNKRFCSRECYYDFIRDKATEILKCEYCNKEYPAVGNAEKIRYINGEIVDRKFCSKECVDKARIGKYVGENSSQWAGGLTSLQDLIRKSVDYIYCRNECFERDEYKSVLSDKGGRLVHHHLFPLSKIISKLGLNKDNWREYKYILFDVDNVVTLLHKEHKLFHNLYGKKANPSDFDEFKIRFNSGEFNL